MSKLIDTTGQTSSLHERLGFSSTILASKVFREFREKLLIIPAVTDYGQWEPFWYDLLCQDSVRLNAFQIAIEKFVNGRSVVEVGTGSRAILATMAARAGAKKVWAIEVEPEAAAAAAAHVQTLKLSDRIEIIQGDARNISLPEPAEVGVSELLGPIASSEGVMTIWSECRHLLAPNARLIPLRFGTWIAPIQLPTHFEKSDLVDIYSTHAVDRFRQRYGEDAVIDRWDIYNMPEELLLSTPHIMERYEMCEQKSISQSQYVEFEINRSGFMDGYLAWLWFETDEGLAVNTRRQKTCWGSRLIPLQLGKLVKGTRLWCQIQVDVPYSETLPNYHFCSSTTHKDEIRLDMRARYSSFARDKISTKLPNEPEYKSVT